MHPALILLLALLPFTSRAAWPGGDYPEVRAFAYHLKGDGPEAIIESGKLNGTATSKTGVLLTRKQVRRLIAAVTGKHPEHPHAGCFKPRHAFVFYDREHTPHAWLEVCFECLNNRSTPAGISGDVDFPALAVLCAELDLPASPDRGFRKGFNDFRREMNKPPTGPTIPGLEPTHPEARMSKAPGHARPRAGGVTAILLARLSCNPRQASEPPGLAESKGRFHACTIL